MRRVNDQFLVGVTGIFFNDKNQVLLVKHSYRKKGRWSLLGGYLKAGEHPKEGLEREVLEETGYKVKANSIIGYYDIQVAFGIAFSGSLVDETQADYFKDEIRNVLWLTSEEILKVKLRPAVKEILQDYINGKSFSLDSITNVSL